MELNKRTLLHRTALAATKPLSALATLPGIYTACRYVEAYLAYLLGKGSVSLNDLKTEVRSVLSCVTREKPVIFDIGANIGEWAALIHSMRNDATVYMFEPAPDCHDAIRALNLPRSILIPMAVSDTPGSATLYSSAERNSGASLEKRTDTLYADRNFAEHKVGVTTIDQVIEDYKLPYVDFVKIDIEGHELSAIRGAKNALAAGKIGAFLFEFGAGNVNAKTFFRDFWDLFTNAGFVLYRVAPTRLLEIKGYYEDLEYFRGETNYIARLKNPPISGR